MGMPYFLDDHGAVIIEFEFGIKGHTKIDETVNDLDGVVGEGGERFAEAPSKGHLSREHALEQGGIEENLKGPTGSPDHHRGLHKHRIRGCGPLLLFLSLLS